MIDRLWHRDDAPRWDLVPTLRATPSLVYAAGMQHEGDGGLAVGQDPLAPHTATPNELRRLLVAERAGCPYLVLRDPQHGLVMHLLDAGGPRQTIGRRSACGLCVSWDTEVSGVHAELEHVSEEWVIVDDGMSRNGTFVNGERVRGRRRLREQDRLRVGRTMIVFRAGGSVELGSTAMAGSQTMTQITPAELRVLNALCRPCVHAHLASPSTNREIADELVVGVDTVKHHLGALFKRFGVDELAQNQKRSRLAQLAILNGLVSDRD